MCGTGSQPVFSPIETPCHTRLKDFFNERLAVVPTRQARGAIGQGDKVDVLGQRQTISPGNLRKTV